ncbi:glycosyl transferase family 2 [Streptococcus mitis 21/39]|jgi:glycosyltransferase|uniref:Glycosyl transferase family 2 n=1 Tax=Streptococcus mitis 21/39 TaxID=1415765 RepID=V8I655_STRMT|nr:glycosyltransferase [Streptococcus mitis]ETD96460.1 glycosyl transferase family 2 [Streptococcus mitis 21/39]
MENELISIIVPIYNVENYLRQCLDSIQNQTYKNFECIMVNDGSTDSSQQIAEEYLTDSRFRLINQSNKGLSGARNTAISHIREESTFISFVDSDDYIYPDFLETLIEHIEDDVDIIEGMIENFHDEIKVDRVCHNFEKKILITKDDKLGELALNELRVSVFPKLFRKSLLTEDFFPEGWIFEDLAVVPELVSHSRKWIKLPKVIYGYRIRPNSITTKEFSEEKLDVFKIFEKYDLFFENENDVIKLLVEKLKYLHLNYHDIEFVPENNQYKQLYQQEKQKLLSKIADYESKALISIIVPIYNVEKYLRQCLDSIIAQTYQNFECLLINDGSPDNSADICREYVSKDSRFRYFEKENGGASSARNLGIECSGGAYITFIDSDDWVDSDYLEVLYRALIEEQADIAISTYKQFNMDDNCYYVHSYQRGYDRKVFTNAELVDSLPLLYRYDSTYNFVSCKLVSREILKYIRFNLSTSYGEDMEFWYKLYLTSRKIVYENKDTYIYRTNNDDSRHFEEEKIRGYIQQRLNFIAIIAARGMNIRTHVDNCIQYLYFLERKLLDQEVQFAEMLMWVREIIFLLEGE